MHAEAPNAVARLGDEAFVHHRTLDGKLGHYGTVASTVRLRNAVITVEYRGTAFPLEADGSPPLGASTPVDEAMARAGAEAAGRDVVKALSSCGTCLTR